jgi:hypothetical protein
VRVIAIPDLEQRKQAFKVLLDLGGSFEGRPGKFIVNDAPYEALVRAGIVQNTREKASRRAKKEAKHIRILGSSAQTPCYFSFAVTNL